MSGSLLTRGWLAQQLPRPMAEDPFVGHFMLLFEDLADSVRVRVNGFEHYLDPGLSPPPFVRYIAGWLGLAIDASLPEGRQRNLLRAAGPLLGWRGTKKGLQGLLEAFTDQRVEITDTGGVFREGRGRAASPHVVVRLDGTGGLGEEHLRELIALELPAHATFELQIAERGPAGAVPAIDLPHGGIGAVDDDLTQEMTEGKPDPEGGTG